MSHTTVAIQKVCLLCLRKSVVLNLLHLTKFFCLVLGKVHENCIYWFALCIRLSWPYFRTKSQKSWWRKYKTTLLINFVILKTHSRENIFWKHLKEKWKLTIKRKFLNKNITGILVVKLICFWSIYQNLNFQFQLRIEETL